MSNLVIAITTGILLCIFIVVFLAYLYHRRRTNSYSLKSSDRQDQGLIMINHKPLLPRITPSLLPSQVKRDVDAASVHDASFRACPVDTIDTHEYPSKASRQLQCQDSLKPQMHSAYSQRHAHLYPHVQRSHHSTSSALRSTDMSQHPETRSRSYTEQPSDANTGVLTHKVQELTKTLSNRLTPVVDDMPPIHRIMHPVLQQPLHASHQSTLTAMQDDITCPSIFGQGKLCFSLHYMECMETLHVKIHRAINLPHHKTRKSVNSYVRLKFPSVHAYTFDTKVQKHTPNPQFEESCILRASFAEQSDAVLHLSVYDHCKVTHDVLIGHIEIHTSDFGRLFSNVPKEPIWREIQNNKKQPRFLGEVHVAICYNNEDETFALHVLEAKKLQLSDGSAPAAGVYVRASLLVKEEVWKSKRTMTDRHHDGHPVFKEEFRVKIAQFDINHVNVILAVYGKFSFSHCEMIGRIILGNYNYTSGQGAQQWNDMLAAPKTPIHMWYTLI